jgi:hypothetical protein
MRRAAAIPGGTAKIIGVTKERIHERSDHLSAAQRQRCCRRRDIPGIDRIGPAIDAVNDPFGWTAACAVAANANRASGPNVLKANVRISPSADGVSQRLTYSDPASYPTWQSPCRRHDF